MAANPLIRDFHEQLSARYPKDGAGMTLSEWLCLNTHLRGRKFSHKGYEFQRAILNDLHPNLWCIKPSQIGLTEIQVRKFLALLARNRGTSGIFTLPNEIMYKRVSKTRIKPLVNGEKAFNIGAGQDDPSRAMNLYEVNGSFGYITGMTEGDATSIPADFLFHDEIDLSEQAIIALYQSRLQNSKFRITQRFSTPTHHGFGVDAGYQSSDQHEYLMHCQGCGHWQVPLFNLKFVCLPGFKGDDLLQITDEEIDLCDVDASYFMCERCSAALDLGDPSRREWVAAHPARRARGYRIRPSATVNLNPAYILGQLREYRKLDNFAGFSRTVLGEPYSDANSKLTEEAIRAVMKDGRRPEIGAEVPIAVGIDIGNTCHLTYGPLVGDQPQPTAFELVPANDIVERVKNLCNSHHVICGAVDRHPFIPTADAIMAASGGRIMPTEYRGNALINVVLDEMKEIPILAQVNRTSAIDAVVKAVRQKTMMLEGYAGYESMLLEHLQDMVRVEEPEKPATWEKLNGNDHFFHALAFLLVSPKIHNVKMMKITSELRTMVDLVGPTSTLIDPPKQPNLGFQSRRLDSLQNVRIF